MALAKAIEMGRLPIYRGRCEETRAGAAYIVLPRMPSAWEKFAHGLAKRRESVGPLLLNMLEYVIIICTEKYTTVLLLQMETSRLTMSDKSDQPGTSGYRKEVG